jgi:hypothetical protein
MPQLRGQTLRDCYVWNIGLASSFYNFKGSLWRNTSLVFLTWDTWFLINRWQVIWTFALEIYFQSHPMFEPRRCCKRLLAHRLSQHKLKQSLLRPWPCVVPCNSGCKSCYLERARIRQSICLLWPAWPCDQTRLLRVWQFKPRHRHPVVVNAPAQTDVAELRQFWFFRKFV